MTRRRFLWIGALALALGGLALQGCEGDNAGSDPETECRDGIDNDEDGLTDCDDPDCAGETHCLTVCNQNGVCEAGEDEVSCPDDCLVVCGDAVCEGDETAASCPQDCIVCGDLACDTGEDRINCPEDCAVCDDGFCDSSEDRASCPEDCAVCDDGFCDTGEDRLTCPEDCIVCDDGHCDAGEDRASCPEDCAVCDDGFCDAGEDRLTCPEDCILCGDTYCDAGEDITNCPYDCATLLVDEDFSTWVPTGWSHSDWLQIPSGSIHWAQCANNCIANDAVLESVVFSTVGYSNVWVSFEQQYQFTGTGVITGLWVDTPPDYYTIGDPSTQPVGTVVYDISTEAANRASVQLEFAATCINTSECFLNDFWRITDVVVWVY